MPTRRLKKRVRLEDPETETGLSTETGTEIADSEKKLLELDARPSETPSKETPLTETEDVDELPEDCEDDYLEFHRITTEVRELLVRELGGESEDDRAAIKQAIDRGRCNFTTTVNPPPEILRDNPKLKDYQVAAVHWLLTLFNHGYNGLVADDMGLGEYTSVCCTCRICGPLK